MVVSASGAKDRSEKTVRKGRETRAGMEGRVKEERLGCSAMRMGTCDQGLHFRKTPFLVANEGTAPPSV